MADDFRPPGFFEGDAGLAAKLKQPLPFLIQLGLNPMWAKFRKIREMNAFRTHAPELPSLLGSEDEQRGEEAAQGALDFKKNSLRRPARSILGGGAIKSVLRHIEIDRAELGIAHSIDEVINAMELIRGIGFVYFLDQDG